MTAQEIITSIISGVALVPVLGWLYPRMNVTTNTKRLLTVLLAFVAIVVAYVLSGLMGFSVLPTDWQTWLDALIPLGATAYTTSQIVFGLYKTSTSTPPA